MLQSMFRLMSCLLCVASGVAGWQDNFDHATLFAVQAIVFQMWGTENKGEPRKVL